jgi:hypothetical protein
VPRRTRGKRKCTPLPQPTISIPNPHNSDEMKRMCLESHTRKATMSFMPTLSSTLFTFARQQGYTEVQLSHALYALRTHEVNQYLTLLDTPTWASGIITFCQQNPELTNQQQNDREVSVTRAPILEAILSSFLLQQTDNNIGENEEIEFEVRMITPSYYNEQNTPLVDISTWSSQIQTPSVQASIASMWHRVTDKWLSTIPLNTEIQLLYIQDKGRVVKAGEQHRARTQQPIPVEWWVKGMTISEAWALVPRLQDADSTVVYQTKSQLRVCNIPYSTSVVGYRVATSIETTLDRLPPLHNRQVETVEKIRLEVKCHLPAACGVLAVHLTVMRSGAYSVEFDVTCSNKAALARLAARELSEVMTRLIACMRPMSADGY